MKFTTLVALLCLLILPACGGPALTYEEVFDRAEGTPAERHQTAQRYCLAYGCW